MGSFPMALGSSKIVITKVFKKNIKLRVQNKLDLRTEPVKELGCKLLDSFSHKE